MSRRSGDNWQNNSGYSSYNYVNNSGNHNGHWQENRRGPTPNNSFRDVHGQGHNEESFTKFRDGAQAHPQFHGGETVGHEQRHSGRGGERGARRGGGGGRGGGGRNHDTRRDKKGRGETNNSDRKRNLKGRGSNHDRRSEGGRGRGAGGRGGLRGGPDMRNNGSNAGSPWYQDQRPDDLYYFDTRPVLNTTSESTPADTPVAPPKTEVNKEPVVMERVKETAPTVENNVESPLINPVNIKKEKESLSKPTTKPKESSDESSSSSSDESVEAGEVAKVTKPSKPAQPIANKVNVKTEPVSKKVNVKTKTAAKSSSSSSSSSEEDSSDESPQPAKVKAAAKISPKIMKKSLSEEDVVCMGNESRNYVIPDEDDDSEDTDDRSKPAAKEKKGSACGICDKKGHTSFECQMICRNCSAQYHSFKNCPNPANLNIALQSFMEFSMQQLAAFNVDRRFTFPGGVITPPVAQPSQGKSLPAAKAKKEKRVVNKKSAKKVAKKKIKMETQNSEDEEDDDDEDEDEDEPEVSSQSESSASSSEPELPKSKRKRNSKQTPTKVGPGATSAFPFPLLAAGAPYSSLMYPYGAPFGFPK